MGTNAPLPATGQLSAVDLVFIDYIESDELPVLSLLGVNYAESDVTQYLPKSLTTNGYLPLYAQQFWSKGPACRGPSSAMRAKN